MGTKYFIDSKLSKSGENIGSVNVLNNTSIPPTWNDEQIWYFVNKPWLEEAAARGDVIRAISNPSLSENIFKPNSTVLSFFGREHEYLIKPISQGGLGYAFDATIFSYVKI